MHTPADIVPKLHYLESYSPNELPEIINAVEKAASNQYEEYKSIQFRMNNIELPESFKFAGVPYSLYPDFANIGRFHDVYRQKMMDKYAPYTEVGYTGSCNGAGLEYIFGCQIRSMEDIPEGLICIDTGVKRFSEIAFRAKTVYELWVKEGIETYGYITDDILDEIVDSISNNRDWSKNGLLCDDSEEKVKELTCVGNLLWPIIELIEKLRKLKQYNRIKFLPNV